MIEDFSSYTEVDPNSRITKATRKVEWTAIVRAEDAFVYKDKTAGFFSGDFTHYLTINTTDLTIPQDVATILVHCWAVTTVIGSRQDVLDADEDLLGVYLRLNKMSGTALLQIGLVETYVGLGGTNEGTASTITKDTAYYLKIVRDESVGTFGALYCYVYSDASRTTLVLTKTLTLGKKSNLRYIYAMQSLGFASAGKDHSGYTEDLELNVATTVYKIECDWDNDGDFLDANEDITADVKSISYSRGKDEELGKANPGTLEIRVNNSDGKYSPTKSGGIFTNLLPKRVIKVRYIITD